MAQTYLNKKQELFAKFLAEGCTQLDAYTNAGYEPSSSNASTLASQPLVKQRVEELRAEIERKSVEFDILRKQAAGSPESAVEVAAWTFQRVMDMMASNVKFAQAAGEYKAANECLKMMGDALKMFEKAQADATSGKQAGPQNTLALIGQVTQVLADASGGSSPQADNPLAPRLPSTSDA
jgi:hypothetical protein